MAAGAFERIFHRELTDAEARGRSEGFGEGRNKGFGEGLGKARQIIMERLIATGMDPGQAAAITAVSG